MAGTKPNSTSFSKTRPAINRKKLLPEIAEARRETKDEVIKCGHSLTRTYESLEEERKDQTVSRLQYLTNKAVTSGNTKFIQWLMEMCAGKPKQEQEIKLEDLRPMQSLTDEQLKSLISFPPKGPIEPMPVDQIDLENE